MSKEEGSEKIHTEKIRLSSQEAISKILELHHDKSVRCFTLMDGFSQLAKVTPDMTNDEWDFVLMSTKFFLSSVNQNITIIIERMEDL